MAIANTPTGDPTPYPTTAPEGTEWRYAGATGDGTITIETPWVDTGWTAQAEPTPPDCREAITILEEAEYELKELLKKASPITYYNPDGTVDRVDKSSQDQVAIALRNVQAALRALLKI